VKHKFKVQSLVSFLSWRLFSSLFVVSFVWIFISQYSYNFALDDTTEFYLYEDAKLAVNLHNEQTLDDSFNNDFRQVYWQLNQLPLDIKSLLHDDKPPLNTPLLLQSDTQDIYLLAFKDNHEDNMIYIVHRFEKSDSIDVFPLFIMFGIAAFVALFVVMLWIISRIKSQTNILVNQLKITADAPAHSLYIEEFHQAISSVKTYYSAQQDSINREREFSNYLSHELRQPMARLSTNLSLVDQLDDLPLESIALLEDMRRVSEELTQLSESILLLWQDSREPDETVDLNEIINHLNPDFSDSNLSFRCKTPSQPVYLTTNHLLVKLVINQLIKNCHQYALSYVEIELTAHGLTITNDLINVEPQIVLPKQFGYGMGLIMVKNICRVLHWDIESRQNDNQYSVSLTFN